MQRRRKTSTSYRAVRATCGSGSPGSSPGELPPALAPAGGGEGGRRRWWGSLVLSTALHAAVLGGLAWAAVPWVRVPPPDDAVFVTLLAGGEEARPGSRAPAGAPEAARAAPEREVREPARRPRVAAPPAPPRERGERSQPRPLARAPAPIAPATSADPAAGAPRGAPDVARDGRGAAVAPGAGGIDASRVYGEGEVDRPAAPVGGIRRPEYPIRERMMGREGRVSLLVTIDAAGAVREVAVARSGGSAFDASARRAVERTRFRAARLADRPVPSTVTVDVSFELD